VGESALDEGALEVVVGISDYNGGLAEGRLTLGDDPRLMTMELGVFASHSCTPQFLDSSVTKDRFAVRGHGHVRQSRTVLSLIFAQVPAQLRVPQRLRALGFSAST
jgi:hypothetical protein